MNEFNNHDPKDFKITDGVLKKYRGKSSDVIIPQGVENIGTEAFEDCKRLTSVVIPHGVTSIGEEAFEECVNLKKISIPPTVKYIYEGAFEECISLASVVIPPSVEYIGPKAFDGFGEMQTIFIEGGEEQTKTFNKNWMKGCKAVVLYR